MNKTTSEQQTIVDHTSTHDGLALVDSVAGAGKTYLLVQIAEQLKVKNGLYLAYNKSIATEAATKFPKSVNCRTTHSIAYGNTVRTLGLKIGNFSYRDIKEKLSYEHKCDVINLIKEFCLSSYTSFDTFTEDYELTEFKSDVCQSYLQKMHEGKIECTHDFYLKMFHILLASGDITFDEYDIIMLDESGDLNEVTLEIFLLLPAKKRIAVGDKHQNIYRFNHTINAFKLLEGKGTEFKLSKSFRVESSIASSIERFCRKYMDPTMQFSGIHYTNRDIKTRAFISRTNAVLVDKMIELNNEGTPYGLVRKASEIFKLPLMVCGLSYQGKIYDPAYKHLQSDIDDWNETPAIRDAHRTPLPYIASLYPDDVQLNSAIRIVSKYGKAAIIEAADIAKSHERMNCNFTLSTAHSCKGLEFDEVVIADDLNTSIEDVVAKRKLDPDCYLTEDEIESLNLWYVAVSRAKKSLINARYL